MPEDGTTKRFEELLSRLLDAGLEESDMREFTAMVKADESLTEQLQTQLLMDSRLAQFENDTRRAETFSLSVLTALDAEVDGDAFVSKVLDFAEPPTAVAASRAPLLITIAALAACLVAVLLWATSQTTDPTPVAETDMVDDGVAIVSSLVGELKHRGQVSVAGDTVSPGILELAEGLVVLEFYNGAHVTVAGPAKLELVNSERVRCHYGKIHAKVPPVAKGFTVVTPDSEVVDLGTEFAVGVSQAGQTQVHVFDGEVDVYDAKRSTESRKRLTAGLAMLRPPQGAWKDIPAATEPFNELMRMRELEKQAVDAEFSAWLQNSAAARQDDRLIAYYDFEPDPAQPRTLVNRALTGDVMNGAVVGANWADGPWPGKRALSFKRPGDRVRLDIPGEYESLSLTVWVRVDGIDRANSSLLLTDGFDQGEVHWQFRRNGSLGLGMYHSDKHRKTYSSGPFVDLTRLGRWVHLATIVDRQAKTVSHYLNGKLIDKHKLEAKTPLRFGTASIGNWNQPAKGAGMQIRNLNGQIAEMMIFRTALGADEIRRLALTQ